jgi:hypothetical protein
MTRCVCVCLQCKQDILLVDITPLQHIIAVLCVCLSTGAFEAGIYFVLTQFARRMARLIHVIRALTLNRRVNRSRTRLAMKLWIGNHVYSAFIFNCKIFPKFKTQATSLSIGVIVNNRALFVRIAVYCHYNCNRRTHIVQCLNRIMCSNALSNNIASSH